jgi:hypothetical protein
LNSPTDFDGSAAVAPLVQALGGFNLFRFQAAWGHSVRVSVGETGAGNAEPVLAEILAGGSASESDKRLDGDRHGHSVHIPELDGLHTTANTHIRGLPVGMVNSWVATNTPALTMAVSGKAFPSVLLREFRAIAADPPPSRP